MFALTVKPGHLSLAELRRAYHEPVQIKLEDQAYAAIDRSVACVNRIVEENRTVYGINTGFGLLGLIKNGEQATAAANASPLVSTAIWALAVFRQANKRCKSCGVTCCGRLPQTAT